jgi:glycosyltransferase involved in cell wall biosynthesis
MEDLSQREARAEDRAETLPHTPVPPAQSGRRYLLISPCRDEAEHLPHAIETVAQQMVPPARWLIVDDGSTDATPRIAREAAERYPWIQLVRREDRGERKVGAGVIEAFDAGLASVDLDAFDYLCKLDADLELPPAYFQRLMERFEADPQLGTLSGKLYLRYGDRLIHEYCGDDNSVGPAKFYRVEAFRAIGGFVREVSWDGIDGHLCRRRGWLARSVDDPELRIIHRRRMGSSHRSFWNGRLRWGRGKWFMGSAWYYVLAVSAYRCFERPYVLSGLGILVGYLRAMLSGAPRYEDPMFRRELRRYERRALLLGKDRALRRYERSLRRTAQRKPAALRERNG